MFDLCSNSLQQGQLPQQKSLEEILKQELTWTLEQVGHSQRIQGKYLIQNIQIGEEEEEEDVNKIHEIVAYTNDAFSVEDETQIVKNSTILPEIKYMPSYIHTNSQDDTKSPKTSLSSPRIN